MDAVGTDRDPLSAVPPPEVTDFVSRHLSGRRAPSSRRRTTTPFRAACARRRTGAQFRAQAARERGARRRIAGFRTRPDWGLELRLHAGADVAAEVRRLHRLVVEHVVAAAFLHDA